MRSFGLEIVWFRDRLNRTLEIVWFRDRFNRMRDRFNRIRDRSILILLVLLTIHVVAYESVRITHAIAI